MLQGEFRRRRVERDDGKLIGAVAGDPQPLPAPNELIGPAGERNAERPRLFAELGQGVVAVVDDVGNAAGKGDLQRLAAALQVAAGEIGLADRRQRIAVKIDHIDIFRVDGQRRRRDPDLQALQRFPRLGVDDLQDAPVAVLFPRPGHEQTVGRPVIGDQALAGLAADGILQLHAHVPLVGAAHLVAQGDVELLLVAPVVLQGVQRTGGGQGHGLRQPGNAAVVEGEIPAVDAQDAVAGGPDVDHRPVGLVRPVGEIDISGGRGQRLVRVGNGKDGGGDAAVGSDARHAVLIVEDQAGIAAGLGQQLLRRPAGADLLAGPAAGVEGRHRRPERAVDRGGAEGNVQATVVGVEGHVEHVRQDCRLEKTPAQAPGSQVDLVDLPVGPAGHVEQAAGGVQGRRIVAVGGQFDLAEAPVVLEIDDVQAGVVVVGDIQLVPPFVVADAHSFGEPGQRHHDIAAPRGRDLRGLDHLALRRFHHQDQFPALRAVAGEMPAAAGLQGQGPALEKPAAGGVEAVQGGGGAVDGEHGAREAVADDLADGRRRRLVEVLR